VAQLLDQAELNEERRTNFLNEAVSDGRRDIGEEERISMLVRERIREPGAPTARLIQVWCSSTLCRIDLEHEDPAGARRLFFTLLGRESFRGQGFLRRRNSDDGVFSSAYFIARDGRQLPREAQPYPANPSHEG
jgi:hypothetical protein